ncbi:DsbA family protein [Candidatus Woesearchaeota archaeon]|nr:DsbA family protein [Candidatus Woesearchaeota archaeon]
MKGGKRRLRKPNILKKLDTPKKRTRDKIKNAIIGILALALVLTWLGPYLTELDITGAFAKDYGELSGLKDGAYFQGSVDAPIEMILFTDFQCPYCTRFYENALVQIKEDYIVTGKVKFVLRHLPLGFHDMAEPAAIAVMCAGRQDMVWEYHDGLFENKEGLNLQYLQTLAEELNLDLEEFNECLIDPEILQQVNLDKQTAAEAGISGTPALLINGEKVIGAQPFSTFKEVIERQLS